MRDILDDCDYDLYVDPFVGAGSVFFKLARPVNSILSDLNEDLISFYRYLKHDPDAVWAELSKLPQKVTKSIYEATRERFNSLPRGLERAARFFFLNRTCFNGVYRVNRHGEFNVPWGSRRKFQFPTLESLKYLSTSLQRATILHCDFGKTLRFARPGAVYYLDPPYTGIGGGSGYDRYLWPPFRRSDLERLQAFITALTESGTGVVISYSGRELPWFVPSHFEKRNYRVFRSISSDGSRGNKLEVCAYLLR